MTVHVKPDGDGWTYGREGEETHSASDRSTAIAEARKLAGVETYDLTKPDSGEVVGQHTSDANENVVLLRPDGSVYGELDAAPGNPDDAQHVDIEPVASSEES